MGMSTETDSQSIAQRLTAVTVTVWLTVWAGLMVILANAPHFSPWDLILPGPDPVSWIAPGALVIPPILLFSARFVSRLPGIVLTSAALGFSALPVLGLLALVIFPVETGYYDPGNPERQPSTMPSSPPG